MLEALNIAKSYRKKPLLRDVSLAVRPGQVTGLLGPNGAGKTTCFHIILGLLAPDSGVVRLNGQDITSLSLHRRTQRGIGYLPQSRSIFRKLSVADNIAAALELRPELDRKARRRRLEALLNRFGLSQLRHQPGIVLSGGECRRAEIARALALEPAFFLLDEPFAGVDPIAIDNIYDLLSHLKDDGIGVLLTDHNVRATLSICDTVCLIGDGQVVVSGTPEQIRADRRAREIYLGDDPRIA